jgi:hypothetical protein
MKRQQGHLEEQEDGLHHQSQKIHQSLQARHQPGHGDSEVDSLTLAWGEVVSLLVLLLVLLRDLGHCHHHRRGVRP